MRRRTAAALRHAPRGADAQRRRRVAEPKQVGGKVGGDGGERFLVAAGVGKQPPQQRTEQRGDAAGQTADIQNLHDAAPKAEDAGHRKAQLQSGLGTVQRGGGHGAEVPVKKAPKEEDEENEEDNNEE